MEVKNLIKNKKLLFTLIFLISLAFTLTSISAASTDYYISPEGNGTGTLDNPTNYHVAVKNIKNGTIYFTEGNYTNIVNQTISKSISLSNYNNSNVVIDLGNKGWAFNINKQSTVTITGLNFINSNYDSTIHSNNKNINLNLINTSFTNGIAKNGGAINIYAGTLNIVNSQFINNIALNEGGAIYVKKGQISLINTNFINNTAINGGAIAQNNAHSIILNNQFINNTAKKGGVLYLENSSTHTEQSNFENNNANNGPVLYMTGQDTAGLSSDNNTIGPASNQTLSGKLFKFIFNILYENYLMSNSNRSILYNIIYKVANEAIYQAVFGTVDNFIIRAIYDSVFDFVFDSAYTLLFKTLTSPKYVYEVLNYSYIRYSSITPTNTIQINSTGEFDANYNWWGVNTPNNTIYSKTEGLKNPENWIIMDLKLEDNNAIVSLNQLESIDGSIDDLDTEYKIPEREVLFTGNVEFENQKLPIQTTVSNPYTTQSPNIIIEAKVDNEILGVEVIPEEIDTPEVPETPNTPEETNTPETPNVIDAPEVPETPELISEIEINNLSKTYGSSEPLTGKLLDTNGQALIGHHVQIKLTRLSNMQSKIYDAVADYKGEYTLPINLAAGNYTAEIIYDGLTINNKTYAKSTKTINLEINSNPIKQTEFTLNEFREAYGETKNFTGRLTDVENNAVIGHHITIELTRVSNGASKTYYATSDYLGEFTLPINLARGEYIAKCSYDGVNQYEGTNTETILTVY